MSSDPPQLDPLPVTYDEIIAFYRSFRAALADPAERKHPLSLRKEHLSAMRQLCNQDDAADDGASALLKAEPHQSGAGASIAAIARDVAAMPDAAVRRRYQEALGSFCDTATETMSEERLSSVMASMTVSAPPAATAESEVTTTTTTTTTTPRTSTPPSAFPPPKLFDPATLFQQLMTSDVLPHIDVMTELVEAGRALFAKEENIVSVPVPCVVVGDIHGQLRDLQRNILHHGGPLGVDPYLFLGDFVDRGAASLHCMAILVCAKLLHPNRVFLIRGNHESRMTNSVYGFLTECHAKYPVEITDDTPPATYNLFFAQPTHPLWAEMNSLFDALPLAAIVGDRIFCVHGGLSPRAASIDTILSMHRFSDIDQGVMSDLTWSDPFYASGFQFNHRGCGQLFGEDVSTEFVRRNRLLFVCRAHQCVKDGFCWAHSDKVLTLFSAPNYCGQGNLGAVMLVDAQLSQRFQTYSSYVEPPPPSEATTTNGATPASSSAALGDGEGEGQAPVETPAAAAPEKTPPSYFE